MTRTRALAPFIALALLARAAAAQTPPPPEPAATAEAALTRASAAYEYGDMNQVIDGARPVVEGALPATEAERVQALRLYGIGLYLVGRRPGAETAFAELLRLRPRTRLDAATTRPEVVAFFEEVRRRHALEIQDAARARSRRSFAWNLLPPLGQFKNGDTGRGIAILAVELASLGTAIGTHALLGSKCHADKTCGDPPGSWDSEARTVRTVNYVSVGVLAATWAVGVVDAVLRSDREPEERTAALVLFPGGAGLHLRF